MTTSPTNVPTESVLFPAADDDEISLLDLLVVVAENLRLLIIGPLLAAALAFGGASLMPRTWESVALIRDASPTLATVATSPTVLIPVARARGLKAGQSLDASVEALRAQIKANFNAKDKVLTLTVVADSAQEGQALASQVLEQMKAASAPSGGEKVRLEGQVIDIRRREEQLDLSILALSASLNEMKGTASSESARNFGALIATARQLSAERATLERQLAGLEDSFVLQPPSLPDRPRGQKALLTSVVAALAVGFLLLLWVFARQALRTAQDDPEAAGKLQQMRAALRRAAGLMR